MKNKAAVLALILLAGCASNDTSTVENEVRETVVEEQAQRLLEPAVGPENTKLKVYKAPAGQSFNNSSLKLTHYETQEDGQGHFEFDVREYLLGEQTDDAEDRGCANSAKGQHIHFIVDNAPYRAHYIAEFEEEVAEGEHVLLAFLSRSYHESIKDEGAAVLTKIQIGDDSSGPEIDLDNDATLFYSRPKGSYKNSAGSRILLDFYLANCVLGTGEYQVRATINEEVWMLNEWAAFFIEGLTVGTHSVKLELLDSNGGLVPGPFNNSGAREFTITAD